MCTQDEVLQEVRDLITGDHKSMIDVEDQDAQVLGAPFGQ